MKTEKNELLHIASIDSASGKINEKIGKVGVTRMPLG